VAITVINSAGAVPIGYWQAFTSIAWRHAMRHQPVPLIDPYAVLGRVT